MGELYTCFCQRQKAFQSSSLFDKLGLVKFEHNGKRYEVYFTKKRANKYSIIHCKSNTIEWEQYPVLPRIRGRYAGNREPILRLSPIKECIRIVVIMGKPNSIIGLDEGVFRSVHQYDEQSINVMSQARFKAL